MNARMFLFGTLVGSAMLASAQTVVRNGDFEAEPSGAGWTIPADSPWSVTNADGATDQFSLRYSSRAAVPGPPVTQTVTLQPGTEYVLRASFKTDGRVRPAVRLGTGDRGRARLVCPDDAPRSTWHTAETRFDSGDATTVVLDIWADSRAGEAQPAPAGSAGVDGIRIAPATEIAAAAAAGAQTAPADNLALGRQVALVPLPSYPLCTDPGDKQQLTDGISTKGYFWTQKSTVGWSRTPLVTITLDLGSDLPVRGAAFSTAAGVAGVEWPAAVTLLLSVDGLEYHRVGDLVAMSNEENGPPPSGKYSTHTFRTESLRLHGRYVKFIVEPEGPFCFVDEVEVFRGDDDWVDKPLPGPTVRYPREYFDDDLFNAAIKRRLGYDLVDVQNRLFDAGLPDDATARIKAEAVRLEEQIGKLPAFDPEGYRSVIPLNELHARIYALHGSIRRAQGQPPLTAWSANPWDFLHPADLPENLTDRTPQHVTRIAAMRGEPRAAAVNLSNSTTEPISATLTFEGAAADSVARDLTAYRVEWTDTAEGVVIATALTPLDMTGTRVELAIPAGMTRQVWFTFRPRALPAGNHQATLAVAAPGIEPIRLPFALRVFDLTFPQQPTLHVGGWDYTNLRAMYGVTPANKEALIAHLRERYVDSPWATSGAMGFGTFDETGAFAEEPDTANFDAWLDLWPDARRYCVFNNVKDSIGGVKIGEPGFEIRVANWIRFWADHARSRDIGADRLVLLLVDEPHRNEQDERIIAWARPIRAAEPDVVIWEDPTYTDPTEALPEMMALSTVLCPNRPMLLREGKPFADFYRAQKAAGRRLDFYSCSGPGFLLDPYAYHRLQAWTCFDFGAESTFFWAFGDTGNSNPWNAYTSKRTSYTPVFLAPDSVTAAKQMEAIRESVQDVEYLFALRRRIQELEQQTPAHPQLHNARRLLADAPRRVLDSQTAEILKWQEPKDRSIADTVRIEVGHMLEKLR